MADDSAPAEGDLTDVAEPTGSSDVAVQDVRRVESVFVSYSREDRTRVGELVDGLNRVGYRVWLDQDLSGGQDWWEAILEQIRRCDAMLLVLSNAELQSVACREELGYARSLGKPVVPVMVEELPIERLPTDLARLQLVDYTGRKRTEAFDLMVALRRLSTAARLPDPLPAPPPVPISYLNDLNELVDAPVLSIDQQFGILGRLKPALGDPEQRDRALEILERLDRRPDLYREPARQLVEALRAEARTALSDEETPDVTTTPPSADFSESSPAELGIIDTSQSESVSPKGGAMARRPGARDYQRPRWLLPILVAGVVAVLAPLSVSALLNSPRTRHQPPAPSTSTSPSTTAAPTTAPTRPPGVPNVYKASEADARAELSQAGYAVQIYRVCSGSVAAGYVRQAIQVNADNSETILVDADGVRPAGQQLPRGTTVTLKISTGVPCT